MTDDAIRIAVGTELGFRYQDSNPCYRGSYRQYGWINPKTGEIRPKLPDFPNDLNACAEFERSLDDPEIHRERFRINLNLACGFGRAWKDSECNPEIVHATARQRCEAFLRTLGKWQEQDEGEK